jgi:toxin ParE1/3/4
MRRLEISLRAERDLDRLFFYGMTSYGLRPADEYLRQMRHRLAGLAELPFIGTDRSDIRPGIRLLAFRAHHIFYRVSEDVVLIARILHHTADWRNIV